MTLTHLHFAKQFFICDKNASLNAFEAWPNLSLQIGLQLHCHPELNIVKVSLLDAELVLLGHIIDPFNPEDSNQTVLNNLIEKIIDFSMFEEYLNRLGGRWVLICQSSKGSRIYHDAAGLKPIFYCNKNGHQFIASQPALLSALGTCEFDDDKFTQFSQHNNSQSWPINSAPYDNVTQLIPNHFLDINKMQSVRFWPNPELEKVNTDEVSNQMNQILKGSIKALVLRGYCSLSLTGGYDSRLLLSAALEYKDQLTFFTIKSNFTPKFDIEIPQQLAKYFKLNHSFVTRKANQPVNDKVKSALSNNVGNMYYDRSMENITAFADASVNTTHLPGSVSEIGRCYYYPFGKRHRKMNDKSLARIAGFKANPIAEEAFSNWLKSLPKDISYYVLDLLYWEHRLGTWASCGLTFREGLMEQIPPMNNRLYMSLSLTAAEKDRLPPYNTTQEIIALNNTDLLKFDFNDESNSSFSYHFPLFRRVLKLLKSL